MDHKVLKNFVENEIEKQKILLVGDAMLDKYYFGEVTRISPEAPVPINRVLKIKETLGGAANVAHNLSLLGCQTSIAARIGNDNHGETFLKKLSDLKIDFSAVIKNSLPTTTKIRIISGHQQMMRLDFEDTAEIFGADEEKFLQNIFSRLENFDAVIISDYGKGICAEKVCSEIISECRRRKKIVVTDPKGDNWKKYFGATFITPNLKELNDILPKKILNQDFAVEAAAEKVIAEFNLQGLVVTRSAAGLSLIEGKNISHIKAKAQEVFDVSGAGDTVISVFALALAGGLDSVQAAYLANLAAGIVVAKVGTYAVSHAELLSVL